MIAASAGVPDGDGRADAADRQPREQGPALPDSTVQAPRPHGRDGDRDADRGDGDSRRDGREARHLLEVSVASAGSALLFPPTIRPTASCQAPVE